jgi:hypothetical protein
LEIVLEINSPEMIFEFFGGVERCWGHCQVEEREVILFWEILSCEIKNIYIKIQLHNEQISPRDSSSQQLTFMSHQYVMSKAELIFEQEVSS